MRPAARGRSGTKWSFVAESAVFVVVCSLGFLLADRFLTLDGVSVWYPPAALTFVYLVRVGIAGAPVALATRLGAIAAIMDPAPNAGDGLVTACIVVVAYTAAAVSYRRLARPSRARVEVTAFVAHAAAGTLAAALGCVAYWVATGPAGAHELASMTLSFWLGDASALVTLAPVLLLGQRRLRLSSAGQRSRIAAVAEWSVVLGAAGGTAWIAHQSDPGHPVLYPLFVPVTWMAMRWGLDAATRVVAAGGLLLPLAAISAGASIDDMSRVQVFLTLLAITGLGLGATETDRHAAHSALEDSEAQLSAAVVAARQADALQHTSLEALEQGIVLATSDGVQLMNRAARAILGTDPAGLTAAFAAGWEILHEDGTPIPHEEQPVVRTILTGEAVADQIVAWDRTPDERVVLRVRTEPIVDETGGFQGIVAAFADITAERAAERALVDAERRFRSAFEEAPFGVQLATRSGVVEVNRRMVELTGRSMDELLGQGVMPFLEPEDAERIWRELGASASAGEQVFSADARVVLPDGSHRWTRGTVVQVEGGDDAVTHIIHVADINEQHLAAMAIAEAEAELRRSFEQSAMPTAFVDPDGRIRRVNAALCDLLGYTPDELIDRPANSVVHPEDLGTGPRSSEAEGRLVRSDGSTIWARVTTGIVRIPDGAVDHYVVQVADITEARAAQAELRASQERFAALVEHSADVIAVLDRDGRVTYLSPAGEEVLRSGHRLLDVVVPDDRAALTALLLDVVGRPGASDTIEVQVSTQRGARNLEIALTNRLQDPHVLGVVANMRDVTERVEAATRLEWQAYHDDLTGLPNRAMLIDRIESSLARARGSGAVTALLYVDLDRFKLVNDTLGHETGDNLLVVIADRLTRLIGGRGMVARLGGDEFVILLENLSDRRHGTDLAEVITAALAEPVRLGSTMVSAAASIGIAFDAGHTPETLLRDADTALYRAKDKGKNRYEVFDDSLRAAALRKVSTEALLRRALDEDELQVHYQPVVDLTSGQVIGAEALLRVPGPGGELQSPAEFIVVADETGLIVPIGAGILDEACRTLGRWKGSAPGHHIAVNVSSRQLASTGFADVVERALESHHLRSDQLVLELTETALIQADRATTSVIDRIHELGVGLAIDDFGTGYGSLAYLKRFPITTVKIDRSFVAGLGSDANDTEIVRAITSLGRSLGMFVIAEGIETREQLELLQELGCDAGQGYLFSPAIPATTLDDVERLVTARFPGPVSR